MRSYGAARTLFSIMGFICWCLIGAAFLGSFLGIVLINDGMFGSPGPFAILAILAVAVVVGLVGFFNLVIVQVGRAGVDSAEYAQQSLQVSREQLELSRQALHQSRMSDPSYAEQTTAKASSTPSTVEVANGASYANRDDATPQVAAPPKHPHALSTNGVETPALAHEPSVPLDTEPPEYMKLITKKKKLYYVGDKTFLGEDKAIDYAKSILPQRDGKDAAG